MVEIDFSPDRTKLRQFGWIALLGFGTLGLVVARRMGSFEEGGSRLWPVAFWILAVASPLLGYLAPAVLRIIYVAMMLVAIPIGFVVGTAILLLLFFLVFTPLALWFKLIRRDELRRRPDPDAATYWIESGDPRSPESYYRQF